MSEPPLDPVKGGLTFSRFRVRDFESNDRLRFKADFKLGASTNGINPGAEQVTVRLWTAAGEFYNQVLNGFTVKGQAPRRRWTLNDAERTRTGLERFDIDEDPDSSGALFLRDVRDDPGIGSFQTVNAEIVIGAGVAADKLLGIATLMEQRDGTGKWREDPSGTYAPFGGDWVDARRQLLPESPRALAAAIARAASPGSARDRCSPSSRAGPDPRRSPSRCGRR